MADVPARRGRPLTYTPEVAEVICERMAEGESLRAICRDEGMPPESTVRRWVLDDVNGFAAQYTRARHLLAERWAEEVLEVSDEVPPKSALSGTVDSGYVQHQRLRVDSRKWLLSKVLPKVYGDKLDVTARVQAFSINVDLT